MWCTRCFCLDHNFFADIGHVDFLEMVYKQAEKPYVIVGLHFDQVHLLIHICVQITTPCSVSSF